MRAAVLRQPNDLQLEHVPEPSCGPGELKIRVTYNGLCGTDATEYSKGPMMVPLYERHVGSGHQGPTVIGHEFIGVVVEEGPGTSGWLGRRVACGAGIACGSCRLCQLGRTNLCERYYTLGLSTHGGLAEFAVAPADICFEIPDDCSDTNAALAQPLAVAIHSVRRAQLRPGDRVALLGVGAIGSFVLAALSNFEGELIAIDIDQSRLDLAKQLGATQTYLLDSSEPPGDIQKHFPGGVDVVFETSGVNGAVARAIELTAKGGTVILLGLNNQPQSLTLSPMILAEKNIVTSVAHVAREDMPDALKLLGEKNLAPLLVDRVVPMTLLLEDAIKPLVAGDVHGKILVDTRV